jgi:hypothetical protein
MHARVGSQVEAVDGGSGDPTSGCPDPGAGQCQHRPVVVLVTVKVEKLGSGGRCDRSERRGIPALAHVDDALEHGGVASAERPI